MHVLRSLYDDAGWAALVREFFDEYRCQTPLFPEIPREFLQYLQEQRRERSGDPPFLLELAHYEWVEIALGLDTRELDDIAADPGGDLLRGVPVLSPLAWPLSYRFPVHRIRPDFQPETPPEDATHLLVYRDRADKVRFTQLNSMSLLLVRLLQSEEPFTGLAALKRVAEQLAHPEPERIVASGGELLTGLRHRDIVLGTRQQGLMGPDS